MQRGGFRNHAGICVSPTRPLTQLPTISGRLPHFTKGCLQFFTHCFHFAGLCREFVSPCRDLRSPARNFFTSAANISTLAANVSGLARNISAFARNLSGLAANFSPPASVYNGLPPRQLHELRQRTRKTSFLARSFNAKAQNRPVAGRREEISQLRNGWWRRTK
jgi:hypothetical protein